jgi:murein DD-endopeptidase MepM/ murein hydrolase activator NlpD
VAAAPVTPVSRQPSYTAQALPPPQPHYQQPQYNTAMPTGSVGGGRGVGSYQPSNAPIETTGSVAPRSVAATAPGYSGEGGQRIIVGTGDSVDTLSRRFNVPAAAILQANRMSGPRQLQPGQQLIIPRRVASAPAPALAAPPATKPAAVASRTHVVGTGETLMKLSRKYNVPLTQLARANNLTATSMLQPGARLQIPGNAPVAAAKPAAEAPKQVAAVAPAAARPQTVPAEPAQKAQLAQSSSPSEPAVENSAKTAEATGGLPAFRWPVRGRVIAGYGAKTNGKQNDGINIAVPEGTPIKAADDGVVAYAGNELKGYGNLVLVRHSNGYVSAYSHASELSVKRGDTIKRGQVVGKAGQTGDVSSPQLHFEIRKGSTPVDPMQFLNGV